MPGGGFSGDGGLATTARIKSFGVAVGPDGSLFLAGDTRVRQVDPGGIIRTVAGTGEQGFSGDGGPATAAKLNGVRDVAVGPDGALYVFDAGNRRVRRVDGRGMITTVGGSGPIGQGAGGFSGDGGPATDAQFRGGGGIAVGRDGTLYIADFYNCRVRRIDPAGTITTVAGSGDLDNCRFSGDGGPATNAGIYAPRAVALAPDGSLHIVDWIGRRVRRVGADGVIATVVGRGPTGHDPVVPSGDGGPAAAATLSRPDDLAFDGDGNLYIVDQGNVRRVDRAGLITTVAGQPAP